MYKKISRGLFVTAFCVLLLAGQTLAALAQNGTAVVERAINATQPTATENNATAMAATVKDGVAADNATSTANISGAGEISGEIAKPGTQILSSVEPESPIFSWGGYFKGIGALFLLLAALWGVVWFLRRRGSLPGMGGLPRELFHVEAQLALSPKRKLLLVRFLNSRLLLGVTDQQITLLKEVEGPDVREESTKSKAQSFADVIAAAGQKNDAP